jgi:hypothetical protein
LSLCLEGIGADATIYSRRFVVVGHPDFTHCPTYPMLINIYFYVMGMTYRVHHGPSNMPAHIPGVPTALAREDWLCPKGQLCQQPAGDSTEEN